MEAERDLNREIEEILNSSLTIDANDDDLEILGNDDKCDYKSDYEIDFENDNEIMATKAKCKPLCTPIDQKEINLKDGRIRNTVALDPILGDNNPPFAPILTNALPGTMPNFNRARVKSVYCMKNLEEDKIINQSFWCKGDTFNIDCRKDSDFWRDPDFYQKLIYLSGQRMIRTWPMEMLDRAKIQFDGKCIGSSYEWKTDFQKNRQYFVPMNAIPVKLALRPIPYFYELKGYAKVSDFTVHWEISYFNNTVYRPRRTLYNPEMRVAEGIKYIHHNPEIKNNSILMIESLLGIYNDYAQNLQLKRVNELSHSPDLVIHEPSRELDCDPFMPPRNVATMKWTNSDCIDPFEVSRTASPDSQTSRGLRSQNSNLSVMSRKSLLKNSKNNSKSNSPDVQRMSADEGNGLVNGLGSDASDSNDVYSNSDQYKTDSQDSIETARMKKKRNRNKKKKKMHEEDFRTWLNEKKAQKQVEKERTRDARAQLEIDNKVKNRTDFVKETKGCEFHDKVKHDHYFEKGWESPSKKTFHKTLAFTNPDDRNSYTYLKPKQWKREVPKDYKQ